MNLTKSQPKVIFFLADAVPTDAEAAAMEKLLGAQIMPRNSAAIEIGGNVENCDAVAGEVPEAYEHLPVVSTYAQARAAFDKDNNWDQTVTSIKDLPGDLHPDQVPASVTPGLAPPIEPAGEVLGGGKDLTQHAHEPGTPSGAGLPPDGAKLGGAPTGAPAAASKEAINSETEHGADSSTGAASGGATKATKTAAKTPPGWGTEA